MRPLAVVALMALVALQAVPIRGQTTSPFSGPGASSAPVEITADVFEIAEANSSAEFTGNVVVTQAGFTLRSEKVVVVYGEGGYSDLKSLISEGRTRIDYTDQSAVGDRAEFDVGSRVLRLIGNVRVENEDGTFTGQELVVDFARGTTRFGGGGGGGRVTGVFTPGE
jgi:lipopolysaccharide export system protein LptA